MAILISRYERRDAADRDAMGRAALELCRACRAVEGYRSMRFYWTSADGIAFISDAESQEVFDRPGTPDVLRAAFALSDLARNVGSERWTSAGEGEAAFRGAGR